MSDPVLQWAGYAQQAGKKYGIPPAVLLGLVHVESGGVEGRVSSANAKGLTQFIPTTAAAYGVDTSPGHARSQIEGAAHYLHDLGYAKNPTGALAAYSGHTAGYPEKVLAAARTYGNAPTATGPAPSATSSSAGGLIDDKKRSDALKALLTIATVAGGAGLVYIGVNQASGGAVHRAARTAVIAGATA